MTIPGQDGRVEFSYDPSGRRVEKRVYTWSEGQYQLVYTRRYAWDGDAIVAEFDGQNHLLTSYTWGIGGLAGGLLGVTNHTAEGGPKTYRVISDATGSVVGLVDTVTGAVAATYRYDPYGDDLGTEGPAAGMCNYRHGGGFYDGETGLYYQMNRYRKGPQWLSRDPIAEQGGPNLYLYCGGDPVNYSDPSGLVRVSERALEDERIQQATRFAAIMSRARGEALRKYIPQTNDFDIQITREGEWIRLDYQSNVSHICSPTRAAMLTQGMSLPRSISVRGKFAFGELPFTVDFLTEAQMAAAPPKTPDWIHAQFGRQPLRDAFIQQGSPPSWYAVVGQTITNVLTEVTILAPGGAWQPLKDVASIGGYDYRHRWLGSGTDQVGFDRSVQYSTDTVNKVKTATEFVAGGAMFAATAPRTLVIGGRVFSVTRASNGAIQIANAETGTFIKGTVEGRALKNVDVTVAEELRRQGLSKQLYQQLVAEAGEIDSIVGVMSHENAKFILEEGSLLPSEAMAARISPAAKARSSVGFSFHHYDQSTGVLTSTRPPIR